MPAFATSPLVTSGRSGEANHRDTPGSIEPVKAGRPTRISSIVPESRGHDFNTWRREISAALWWLGERLDGRDA